MKLSLINVLGFLGARVGATTSIDENVATTDQVDIGGTAEIVQDSSAQLFPRETIQLTDGALARIRDRDTFQAVRFYDASIDRLIASGTCRVFPGEAAWPSKQTWAAFNETLGGVLIETIPFASVCYNDFGTFDAGSCSFRTINWVNNSYIHVDDPTSVNAVLLQGETCMPPSLNPSEKNCTVGGYPSYVVNVSTVAHIQQAVNFARNLNLRLVIKNTGHDFGAKSTGAGSLSIWTHWLKDIRFMNDYADESYRGPAFKLGSGVQAFEFYAAAKKYNVTVVGGEGRTVGVMGGYIAGGGHSPLSSLYGMAADQVLSIDIVTADGMFVTASATRNPDLFWALRGGGGSTYGVVTSLVVRAYPKMPVAIMSLTYATGPQISDDTFWQGFRAFFDGYINYTDVGNYEYFRILNLGPGSFSFDIGPWFAPNMTENQLRTLTAPYLSRLASLGISVSPIFQSFDNYYDAWWAGFPLEPWSQSTVRTASRLFPRSNWKDEGKRNATFNAIRSVVEEGAVIIAFNIAGRPLVGSPPDNAVLPAWRETVMHCIMAKSWNLSATADNIQAASDTVTFDWMDRWRKVSPGAGAYMSEADYIEPDFQHAFWGSKYERLYQVKQQLDPLGVFYAQNAVGSEDWNMSAMLYGHLPSQNSKLCRK